MLKVINNNLQKIGIEFQCRSTNDLLEVQFLLSERFNIHINISTTFYIDGTNYEYQILIFDVDDSALISTLSTGIYGDNGEFLNIYDLLFDAIEKSITIVINNSKYFNI